MVELGVILTSVLERDLELGVVDSRVYIRGALENERDLLRGRYLWFDTLGIHMFLSCIDLLHTHRKWWELSACCDPILHLAPYI